MKKRMKADIIGGFIGIVLGIISILEAIRLYPLRMSTLVGDHTLPGLLGIFMVVLGIVLILKNQHFKVEMPDKQIGRVLVLALSSLTLYVILIPYLGYLVATGLGSVALFKIFGLYRWKSCALLGAGFTASLYLIFILWLNMPFPTGIFNL